MASHASPSQAELSLFPFLSVLCCVIGVLSLIIISQVMDYALASEGISEEGLAPAQALRKLQEQRAALDAQVQRPPEADPRLPQALRDAEAEQARLAAEAAALARAREEKEESGALPAPARGPEKQGTVVRLVPDQSLSQVPKRPVIVECIGERIRLHTVSKLEVSPVPGLRLRGTRDIRLEDFQKLIGDLECGQEYLLLIVRQSGIRIYDEVRRAVAQAGRPDLTLGVEPLPDDLHAGVVFTY